ncbi:LPD29 domain-containing protein [Vibrio sp. TRT 29B02]|uniref:LPD29 domain-containing protein n=1 Tax=Vibrio sp. TRT 29B02 TaxID=3418508 RepID=UPI003CF12E0F
MISNYQGLVFVGQPVYMSLYNTGFGYVVEVGEGCNKGDCKNVCGVLHSGGGDVKLVFKNGTVSNYPESMLRSGVQCGVLEGEPASSDDLIALLENAEKVAAEKAEQERQEQEAFRVAVSKVGDEYPHLKQLKDKEPRRSELAHVADNIRKELKPLGKFSVRTRHSSVYVSWEDGANMDAVKAITDKYKGGSFNGMEDIYEHSESAFNAVFGSASYIFTDRTFSDKAVQAVCDKIASRFTHKPTVEEYRTGRLDFRYETEFHKELKAYHVVPEQPAGETKAAKAVKAQTTIPSDAKVHSAVDNFTVSEEEHTKTHAKLFVVRLQGRVERETFTSLRSLAKQFQGYWSKFKGGFIFASLSDAEAFMS